MELRIYTPELNLIGIIENFTSLIWTRKFYEPGTVELHCPITDYNISLLKLENIISKIDSLEAAVIEDVRITQAYQQNKMVIKGRFLSSYMDRRLIRPRVNFSGMTEVAMRTLLNGVVQIPLVRLGDLKNFEETVEFQATYKNLL